MNIHEYQAKKLLSQYGINIPKGAIAYTPNEAKRVAGKVSLRGPWVLKAQIQSGARKSGHFINEKAGKKGGIRQLKSRRDIIKNVEQMLGSTLVTSQTGPKGKLVSRVYVESFCKVNKFFYAGMIIDGMKPAITLLVADTKDKDISEIAINSPEKILKIDLPFHRGVGCRQIQKVMDFINLPPRCTKNLEKFINNLHKAFLDTDATMIEINPVGVMAGGKLVALDAKMSFDDNALYRHKNIKILQDDYESDALELQAEKYRFTYSSFDGNIGFMVNGDGLAMALMDMLQNKGYGTACSLNVRGNFDKDKIASGIKIIMSNPRVEGMLINILGGFVRCNRVAEGIVLAASEVGLNIPVVVHFEGTNQDEAKEILLNSKLPIIIADEMNDAADKIIQAIEESN